MVERLQPKSAITKVRFELSAVVSEIVVIPVGTRVTPGNNLFFATNEEHFIKAGELSCDAVVTCNKLGTIGNSYVVGSINILVDPINYVARAINLETSQGGADIETDDNLRMRIYMKPDSFSVAGPDNAYKYFAYEFSQNIQDCNVVSPVPGEVKVVVVLVNGEIPQTAFLSELVLFLENKRPLTDNLEVLAPEVVDYDLSITYYITNKNKVATEIIKNEVSVAVNKFIQWQKSKLGRDINPNELVRRVMECGIKRVEVALPTHTVLEYNQLAVAQNITLILGGYEDE